MIGVAELLRDHRQAPKRVADLELVTHPHAAVELDRFLTHTATRVGDAHFCGGNDALAPFELEKKLRAKYTLLGVHNIVLFAMAGIDMAAWDALARAAGVPLCVLLGGSTGAVPAYNSNGLWLRSPAEVAKEAVELREEGGFDALKLRLGRERLASTSQPSV